MKTKFLKHLICIECRKGNLKLNVAQGTKDDVKEGTLTCSCGRIYAVNKGIPRMLPKALESDKKATAAAFGKKWHQFGEIQKHHEAQFLDWIWPITKQFVWNKKVLDAGCGQGRHTYFSAKYGAKLVFGVDLSNAVEVAYENTKQFPNVCIVQADIYKLPFKEKSFDYAFCIGVLHHLPAPERAFDKILGMVKSNGVFSSWVYGRPGLSFRVFDFVRRNFLCKISLGTNYLLSLLTTIVLYPVIKLVYVPLNSTFLTRWFAKGLPNNDFMLYLGNLGFRMTHEILYDQFIAPTAYYYTGKQFQRWFMKPEIKNFTVTERNKNSWRGTATKN